MKEIIKLDCLSRGGSNVFASLMHCHPNVYSIALRFWARSLNEKSSILNEKKLIKTIKSGRSIYFSGGFYKDFNDIKSILLEKTIEKNTNIKSPTKSYRSIIMLRNPLSVITSLHDFAIKYKNNKWLQTEQRIDNLIKDYYMLLIKRAKENKDCHFLLFESLLDNPDVAVSKVCSFLGIPPVSLSFKKAFETNGCEKCRNMFTNKNSDTAAASRILVQNNKKFPMQPHYYCPRCKQLTLGFGGFNPFLGLKKSNQIAKTPPEEVYKSTIKILTKYFGQEICGKMVSHTLIESDLV